MCCGAVPIRTPTGGWTDQFVDGESGFIIPFNDAPALADRILSLSNRDLLMKMRQNAMAFASAKFSKKAMIDGTSDLFRGVASGEVAA
jgi:glycosyltransferase involved in cell wall biosynthesis